MTDQGHTTRIRNAQGQTHTGSGTQNIIFLGLQEPPRPRRDPWQVALERRQWLRRRFIGPPGYRVAAERLEEPGSVVLLSGAPGSGRRSAATILLHCAGDTDDPFREATLDPKREDPDEIATGERILFDLSGLSDDDFITAQGQLAVYWEKIRQLHARLVVVLPHTHEHLLRSDFLQLRVQIGRPDGAGVLARHLRSEGIELTRTDLRGSCLGRMLGSSSMQELQRLSELVVRARADGGDFHAWAGRADEALQDRSHEVAQQVADLTDGRQRALLFTAAMLDEAPAATVFRFADRLLSRLGHPEDERPRLDRTDLTRRLHELPVKVRGERIHFEGLAYAAAIRTHFWLYYPDLRAAFGDWVADAVTEFAWLGPADRNHFVARYTEHALKADDVRTLTDLVESWATDGKLLPEAELVLALGLMSDARGSAFRAKIYEWAVKPGLSSQLARLLTRTCVEAMAPLYPDQALVRLHHLARREGDHGRPDSAQTALLELVRQNHALCVRLLNRVCSGMEKHEFADVGIFLVLMDPLPGWVQHDVAVRGWRGVLDLAPPAVWSPKVRAWLSAARCEPDGGARLMRILIDAADRDVDVLSRFYLLAYDWSAEPDDASLPHGREDIAARFRRAIDRAQGVEPLDLTAAGVRGGRGN